MAKDKRDKVLGFNVKVERMRKGFTQADLAEKVNSSEGTISLIERGLQTPSVFLVLDIAKTLEIDLDVLLKGC